MNFIKNRFMWNCIAGVCGAALTGCYIWEKSYLLALCWCIITICNIALAYLTTQGED